MYGGLSLNKFFKSNLNLSKVSPEREIFIKNDLNWAQLLFLLKFHI